jgi:sortase A
MPRRRLTDQIPLGVECALPQIPSPAAVARPEPKGLTVWIKLVLVATAPVVVAGLWMLGQAAYVHAKAWGAQALLDRAWERTLAGEREVQPWPWADTWPVARLTLPERNLSLYVLTGANAFGPGHILGTALPGEDGNSVIGGQLDTHLAFLKDVKRGSEIIVERRDGARRHYRVQAAEVFGERETWVMKQDGWTHMTLVTGYPFDALRASGPLRYVVFADAIKRRS